MLNSFEISSESSMRDKGYYLCGENINDFYSGLLSTSDASVIHNIVACGVNYATIKAGLSD